MFRSMPVILILAVSLVLLLNPFLPLSMKADLYAISLTVKSAIIFVLPLIIFSLLFKTMVNLANRATLIIVLIIAAVCLSNFISTFLSHFVGEYLYHIDIAVVKPEVLQSLSPAWNIHFPTLVSNDKAMFAGILSGIILGRFKKDLAFYMEGKLETLTTSMLNSFTYLIPVFVVGFSVKLASEGVIQTIIKDYTSIFLMIAATVFSYIFFLYWLANRFDLKSTFMSIKNMLPAAIAGFSTMSSAAVMPLTLTGVEKNTHPQSLAKSIVPVTVNVHLIGDCFAIPILAYALMKSYGMPMPLFSTYVVFMSYFVLAKFSVAAIPGGGIIVMLSILEAYLGFTGEMLSLITALYLLFDPVITCANVLGNGAFAKLLDGVVSEPLVIAKLKRA